MSCCRWFWTETEQRHLNSFALKQLYSMTVQSWKASLHFNKNCNCVKLCKCFRSQCSAQKDCGDGLAVMPGSSGWWWHGYWSVLGAKFISARSFSPGKINNANDNFIPVHLSLFRSLRICQRSVKWLAVLERTVRCDAENVTLVHIISVAPVLLSLTRSSRHASTSTWLVDSSSQIALSGECSQIPSLFTLRCRCRGQKRCFRRGWHEKPEKCSERAISSTCCEHSHSW